MAGSPTMAGPPKQATPAWPKHKRNAFGSKLWATASGTAQSNASCPHKRYPCSPKGPYLRLNPTSSPGMPTPQNRSPLEKEPSRTFRTRRREEWGPKTSSAGPSHRPSYGEAPRPREHAAPSQSNMERIIQGNTLGPNRIPLSDDVVGGLKARQIHASVSARGLWDRNELCHRDLFLQRLSAIFFPTAVGPIARQKWSSPQDGGKAARISQASEDIAKHGFARGICKRNTREGPGTTANVQ